MELSIVTVNYKSWKHLEASLNAVAVGFPSDWEMIVVDNESNPEDLDAFKGRYPWVKFIPNPANSGFGCGCNIGARTATGDTLLFMNPDVIAKVSDLRSLLELKQEHQVGIIAPQQISTTGKLQKVFDEFPNLLNQSKTLKALLRILLPWKFNDPRKRLTELTYCDWVTGSVLMIDREHFQTIGGWTEDYWMYVEDADLCRKAHDAGLSVACTPDVEVVHAHGGSSRINVAVKSMTKLEVIISKHVYANLHKRGLTRFFMHTFIVILKLPPLVLAGALNLLTLGRVPALRVRARMLTRLLSYYRGVMASGSWLSPRAIANQSASV